MKKRYTTSKYKLRQRRKLKRINRRAKLTRGNDRTYEKIEFVNQGTPSIVIAPKDFRLLENTEKCLKFFNDLRKVYNHGYDGKVKIAQFSLNEIEYVDYSSMSILIAIKDALKFKNTYLRGDFPKNEHCKKFIQDSGLLNDMYDIYGKKFERTERSEELYFKKGSKKFSIQDNIRVSELVKSIVKHLTGKEGHCSKLRAILLEIFANAIEWSSAENNQWLLGAKYEEDKVTITVTDVGKGILKTLHRKFDSKVVDFIQLKDDLAILNGAFNKKYGSTSKKANRNKGLPAIKNGYIDNRISNLKVLTNNVILHFDNEAKSRIIDRGTPRFRGTFYRWEVYRYNIEI